MMKMSTTTEVLDELLLALLALLALLVLFVVKESLVLLLQTLSLLLALALPLLGPRMQPPQLLATAQKELLTSTSEVEFFSSHLPQRRFCAVG